MSQDLPTPLSPQAAFEMLRANPKALLIDIRSTMEFLFVGHPLGAIHIPWMDEPDWEVNSHFVTEIRKLVLGGAVCEQEGGCTPIILICRSGKRSLEAGRTLIQAGFKAVFHIDEGFEGELNHEHHRSSINGWRFRGLPWEQC
ncbi:rhodanese-like domain-containing protein [Caldichromatium japonicum]|uniref:Rhodanese-like domain-containing protein n=1 Tax=Caldichromatium japonicum TaxID=2699430 RepID=A0A6G7VE27_9GAMM|nr:rhodanese-like domain-containing protein [Caldichromatium japonicum]QIK38047.1 rhodanese-like domain-containing protein [Caldichromatium japonicum]